MVIVVVDFIYRVCMYYFNYINIIIEFLFNIPCQKNKTQIIKKNKIQNYT